MSPTRKNEKRQGPHGEVRWMAEGDGYVMCRHKGCMPFVMSTKEWEKLPLNQPALSHRSNLRYPRFTDTTDP